MRGKRNLDLLVDVSNTRRRIDFQLTLAFAKHVFDSRIVLLVVLLMFTEFGSSTMSAFVNEGHGPRCSILSKSEEIWPHILFGVSACPA